MPQQYDDLVKIVQGIEKEAAKVEFNSIDISLILTEETERQRPEFRKLLELALDIETGHVRDEKRQRGMVRAMQVQPRAEQAQAKAQQREYVEYSKPAPSKTAQQAAKDEINAFANNLNTKEPEQPGMEVKVQGSSDLVLPQLSVSDQISELEHILEGIHEHVFDDYHMQIVKKEVYCLNKKVLAEDSDKEKHLSQIEQSFMHVRNQRLSELMSMLGDA